MGRELQKKKKRSSIAKVKQKPKSKRINPLGNPIIAANWNQKETLSQNYRRLGLTSRLNTATGGIEKLRPTDPNPAPSKHSLAISGAVPKTLIPTEARVERDAATGKITRVVHAGRANPLNDLLNSDSDDDEDDGEEFEGFEDDQGVENEVVKKLQEQAARPKKKTDRKQSDREREWVEALVGKHGEDYGKMVRDMKLNPMQQTEGDIKRRIAKWRAASGSIGVEE